MTRRAPSLWVEEDTMFCELQRAVSVGVRESLGGIRLTWSLSNMARGGRSTGGFSRAGSTLLRERKWTGWRGRTWGTGAAVDSRVVYSRPTSYTGTRYAEEGGGGGEMGRWREAGAFSAFPRVDLRLSNSSARSSDETGSSEAMLLQRGRKVGKQGGGGVNSMFRELYMESESTGGREPMDSRCSMNCDVGWI